MSDSFNQDLLGRLRQQLRIDQLLGLREVPVAPETFSRSPSRSTTLPETHQSSATAAPSACESATRQEQLRRLDEDEVKGCTKCSLCETRTQTVFGQGNASARLVFVGEAPGFEEDRQGLAFVGKAGQLLTRMISAMGLTREEVFICNVLKCRPPGNRDPSSDEIFACSPYLRQQIAILQPEVMVALGAPAAKTLLNTAQSIGKLRGRFHEYFLSGTTGVGPSVPLMPTYHPAYLLRSPNEKRKTWDDLQEVMNRLGLPRPAAGNG